ncbi:MAG TPA: hypothetical protein VHL34_10035 [Rhizomicrobium sp.]|jgi:hypothetical protein|nr:hypothetical protein [Rhizomicrobium sp.]
MTEHYRYYVTELERGRTAFDAFVKHVQADKNTVGVFAPQLGFASNEAAVLMTSHGHIDHAPHLVAKTHDVLIPTIRPKAGDTLKPGGIYVHRWFTVDHDKVAEFVSLSGQAWPSFEGEFEANIFGLFTAERSEHDIAQQQTRLLLLTWYKDHAVWEASRRPTREPEGIFMKRHTLTRTTIGRSTLLVA